MCRFNFFVGSDELQPHHCFVRAEIFIPQREGFPEMIPKAVRSAFYRRKRRRPDQSRAVERSAFGQVPYGNSHIISIRIFCLKSHREFLPFVDKKRSEEHTSELQS